MPRSYRSTHKERVAIQQRIRENRQKMTKEIDPSCNLMFERAEQWRECKTQQQRGPNKNRWGGSALQGPSAKGLIKDQAGKNGPAEIIRLDQGNAKTVFVNSWP